MGRLRRGTREIEDHLVAGDGQATRDPIELFAPLSPTGGSVDAVGDGLDALAQLALGELLQGSETRDEVVEANRVDELSDLCLGYVGTGDESAQVHLDQHGDPNVRAEDIPYVGDLDAGSEQADRRDPQPLLVALGRRWGEGAHHQPAHVDQVRRQGGPGHPAIADKDRTLDEDVARVQPASVVRVIGEVDITRQDPVLAVALDGRPNRSGGGNPVEGHQTRRPPRGCRRRRAGSPNSPSIRSRLG